VRAVEGFSAYAGTYSLDGNVVTHHVQFALNPELKGRDLRRSVRLEHGRLFISTRNLGSPRTLNLVWERVRVAVVGTLEGMESRRTSNGLARAIRSSVRLRLVRRAVAD